MAANYFKYPWAENGDVTTIPETIQPDGSVSMDEGFGADYSKSLSTDPDAKVIPRGVFNEIMNLVTTALAQYQTQGVPNFIAPADNDGSPYSYVKGAQVRYNAGGGAEVYQSIVNSNTALPTDATKWIKTSVVPGSFVNFCTITATGTLLLTSTSTIESYVPGLCLTGVAAGDNTSGAVTVNLNGLGAKNVRKMSPGGSNKVALAARDIVTDMIPMFIYDGTDMILLNPMGVYGSILTTFASAATLDLSSTVSNYISITGTTTITAVTLTPGREISCVAAGIFQMTASAGMILPANGGNITTAVGDCFVLRGETSGVRVVDYQKADGTAVVSVPTGNDIQIFTASGTWNKPAGFNADSTVFIEGWGGGASGSGSGSGYNSGSGGGAYWSVWKKLSDLGSSESVTVGAGGTGVLSTQGQNGGNSQVGTHFLTYGGTAGTTGNSNVGGAGGSPLGQSALGTRTTVALSQTIFSTQGDGGTNGVAGNFGGLYNGGGGASGNAGGSQPGGGAMMGGGGGGGGGSTSNAAGGVSKNGGNGGKGQATVQADYDGLIPGGGGGGNYASGFRPGHGGRGEVRISVFRKV